LCCLEADLSGTVFIALMRGINVGGHRKVPMAELRKLLDGLGFEGVQTYVQSGNAVFRAEGKAGEVVGAIEKAIEEEFGFPVTIFLLDNVEWAALVKGNPYPEVAGDPTKLHLFVLDDEPGQKEVQALEEKTRASLGVQAEDRYTIAGRALYLHTPNGIGRSKLAEIIGRTLKVEMTARNWRTVLALWEMAASLA
jgi:uncharacterized protein (DUF1697 family)